MSILEEDVIKLKEGIHIILMQWPLLVGVIESQWNEFEKKKLRLLPKLMDCTKYDFNKMPYKESRIVLVNELVDYIEEIEVTPEDIWEFLLVYVDEVFDAMPEKNDKSHEAIASAIYRLMTELDTQTYEFYKEIIRRYEEIKDKKMMTFVDYQGKGCGCTGECPHGEGDSEGSEDMEDNPDHPSDLHPEPTEVQKEIEEEEESKKAKSKAKKNQGFNMDDMDDDMMAITAGLVKTDDKDKKGKKGDKDKKNKQKKEEIDEEMMDEEDHGGAGN